MCDLKTEGGRRCPGRRGQPKPNTNKTAATATNEKTAILKPTKAKTKPKAVPVAVDPAQAVLDENLDLTAAMARAEADGAAHAAWLTTEPTRLEMELAHLGLAGLADRYGFDHTAFGARFLRHDDLTDLALPGVGPVPTPEPGAGELGAVVVKPAAAGSTWHPMSGLSVTWRGGGDAGEREKFMLLLGSWFSGLFAALRTRMDHQRAA